MKIKSVIQIIIEKIEDTKLSSEDVCNFLKENKKQLLFESQEEIEIAYNEATKHNGVKYQNANDYYTQTYE